jgi:hypothetical protein
MEKLPLPTTRKKIETRADVITNKVLGEENSLLFDERDGIVSNYQTES